MSSVQNELPCCALLSVWTNCRDAFLCPSLSLPCRCACKACSYCVEALQARVPCSSFAPKGDVDYERCDSFCDSRFSEVHCSLCRCRGCSYCEDIPICDPIIRDDCACEPTTDKDSRTMQCASWCTKDTHCKQCKCAGCPLCASRTSIPRAPPQLRPPLILATQAASSNEHPAAALLRPPVPPEPSPWPPEEAWSPTPSPPPGSNGGLSIASAPPSGAIRSEYGGHAAGEAFVQGNVLPGSGDFPPHTSQQLDASPTDTLFAEVSTIVAIVVLGATLLAIAGCAIRASASFLGVWSEHDLPRSRRAGRRQAERSGTMSIRAEETMTRSAEQPLQIPVNLLVEGTSLLLGGLEKQLLKGMNAMRLRALVLKMVIEHEDEFLKDDPVSMHDLQLEVRNRFGQTIALTSQSTLPSGIRAINARVR